MIPKFVWLASIVASISFTIAAPIMYVDDSSGRLASVDVATGNVNLIGTMDVVMTDIAFDPTGALFGVSFVNLYSINPNTSGVTLIGRHSVPAANALVFGEDGTLYAAGSNSTALFTINPATGASKGLGDIGFASGGDLAFYEGHLYLASSSSELVQIDLPALANTAVVGPFGVPGVFGLATGDNGVLYGVAGTQIFSVDTLTGTAMNPVNYAGQGLGTAFGQSFYTEAGAPTAVPEPSLWALVFGAISMLLIVHRPVDRLSHCVTGVRPGAAVRY